MCVFNFHFCFACFAVPLVGCGNVCVIFSLVRCSRGVHKLFENEVTRNLRSNLMLFLRKDVKGKGRTKSLFCVFLVVSYARGVCSTLVDVCAIFVVRCAKSVCKLLQEDLTRICGKGFAQSLVHALLSEVLHRFCRDLRVQIQRGSVEVFGSGSTC